MFISIFSYSLFSFSLNDSFENICNLSIGLFFVFVFIVFFHIGNNYFYENRRGPFLSFYARSVKNRTSKMGYFYFWNKLLFHDVRKTLQFTKITLQKYSLQKYFSWVLQLRPSKSINCQNDLIKDESPCVNDVNSNAIVTVFSIVPGNITRGLSTYRACKENLNCQREFKLFQFLLDTNREQLKVRKNDVTLQWFLCHSFVAMILWWPHCDGFVIMAFVIVFDYEHYFPIIWM